MRDLVESLLTLTRGDEGAGLDVGRHDLAAVAEEAVQTTRDAADGKVSVGYVPPGNPVEAIFDRDRVLQVASILLDNAVKYTPEGGSVAVKLREEDGPGRRSRSRTRGSASRRISCRSSSSASTGQILPGPRRARASGSP